MKLFQRKKRFIKIVFILIAGFAIANSPAQAALPVGCYTGAPLGDLLRNYIKISVVKTEKKADLDGRATDRCLRLLYETGFSRKIATEEYIRNLRLVESYWREAPEEIIDLLALLQTDWENQYEAKLAKEISSDNTQNLKLAYMGIGLGGILLLRSPSLLPKYFSEFRQLYALALPALGAAGGLGLNSALNAASASPPPRPAPAQIVFIPEQRANTSAAEKLAFWDDFSALLAGSESGFLFYILANTPEALAFLEMRAGGWKKNMLVFAAGSLFSWGVDRAVHAGSRYLQGRKLRKKLRAGIADLQAAAEAERMGKAKIVFERALQLASYANLDFLLAIRSAVATFPEMDSGVREKIHAYAGIEAPRRYPAFSGAAYWENCGCRSKLAEEFAEGIFSDRYDELLLAAAAYIQSLGSEYLGIYADALIRQLQQQQTIVAKLLEAPPEGEFRFEILNEYSVRSLEGR